MTRGHNRREKARRKRRKREGAYVSKQEAAKRKAASLMASMENFSTTPEYTGDPG